MSGFDEDFKRSLDRIENSQSEIKDLYHELDKKHDILASKVADHFDSDEKNLSSLTETLGGINDRLIDYNKSLAEHIAGVEELRNMNALIRREIEQRDQATNEKMRELEAKAATLDKPRQWAISTAKAAVWITSVTAAGGAVWMALEKLSKLFH